MKARVDSVIRIPRELVSPEQLDAIEEAVSYPNPAYVHAVKQARALKKPVPFWIKERLSTLEKDIAGDEWIVPRGATHAVRTTIAGVALEDQRLSLPPVVFGFVRELRSYQAPVPAKCRVREQGMVVMPTGSGKTTTLLATVAFCGQPTLILVPTLDLVEQTAQACNEVLGVDPGIFAAGKSTLGRITIATPQSALANLSALERAFGCVMVDECHHAASVTISTILARMPARFRFGWTATPTRSDGLSGLVLQHVGSMIHEVTVEEVTKAGHMVQPLHLRACTGFRFDYRGPRDWPKLLEALVSDEERNALIVDEVIEAAAGDVSFVLTGRVGHAHKLAERFEARGQCVGVMVGTLRKKFRARMIHAAREGELNVLIATQLADEGLDIPRLSTVALTFPSRSEGRLLQRIGRVLRPFAGKQGAKVLDFVDEHVGVLLNQARRRRATFRRTWPEAAA